MRYAFVSDVHANLPAWNAVLTDMYSLGVSRIVCLGDIVGYGPQPAEVLEAMYSRVHHFVLGNHDAVLCGKTDPNCFNDRARANIEWTQKQVDAKATEFFGGLPFVIEGDGFRCAHASPVDPDRFPYVVDSPAAAGVLAATAEPLVIVGHSHVPCVFSAVPGCQSPEMSPPRDFILQPGVRYVVNAGSVGQPRNGDVRASYCILDSAANSVIFRQVPFDLDAYRTALERSTLPAKRAYFLRVAVEADPGPLREALDFRPPARGACLPAEVGVLDLKRAVRAARAWKIGALVLGLCLAGVLAAGLRRGNEPDGGMVTFPARLSDAVPAPEIGIPCFVSPRLREKAPGNAPFAGWTVSLADPDTQSVTAVPYPEDTEKTEPEEIGFRIASQEMGPFELRSRAVRADRGVRMRFTARFLADPLPEGHLALTLLEEDPDGGSPRILLHYPVANLKEGTWKFVRKSTPPEGMPRDTLLRLCLTGEIRGEVTVRTLNLERTE